MSLLRVVSIVVLPTLAILASCGDSGGSNPDVSDAGVVQVDAACPIPQGTSYIASVCRFLPETEGRDLDGDGVINNEFGALPQEVLQSVNDSMVASMANGELLVMFLLADWNGTNNDDNVALQFFGSVDADQPANPDNDFCGGASFDIDSREFDLDCNPSTASDEGRIEDGILTAQTDLLSVVLRGADRGILNIGDAQVVAEVIHSEISSSDPRQTDPDTCTYVADMKGILTGYIQLCSMTAIAFPGDVPGSILDGLVNQGLLGPDGTVQIDIDVDGDGIEQVIGDGVSIKECIDGDGTVITGAQCPCHPAIADGLSIAFTLEMVLAVVSRVL